VHVEVFSAVGKANVPVISTGRFKGDVQIRLMAVRSFVPGGTGVAVVMCGTLLVNYEIVVGSGHQEKLTIRSRFNVPLEVRLVNPLPGRKSAPIMRVSSVDVQEGSDSTLNGQANV